MGADLPTLAGAFGGAGETIDEILGGSLRIVQKRSGYRFSIDALLLAHFVVLREGEECLELGAGSGVVALILAQRCRCRRILGIDIQEELVSMARRSAEMNNLAGCVEFRRGDVRHPESLCAPISFDAVVLNPPYRRLRSGRMNPDPAKAIARHEVAGTIGDFLAAAAHALREGGRVTVIYPARRMAEMIFRMRGCRIEPKRIRIVHSRSGGVGEFLLIEGVKGGGEELTVLPPLLIYDEGGAYSAEMAAIFRELSASPAAGGGRSPVP
ncbi:MAG: tRNA1(Val) (adenine(37)-N6)-methyltransferase [Syntrophales bacterium]